MYLYLYRRVCVYPSGRIHVAACGPIGTKFGTRMEIHLEMVMGEIKITSLFILQHMSYLFIIFATNVHIYICK